MANVYQEETLLLTQNTLDGEDGQDLESSTASTSDLERTEVLHKKPMLAAIGVAAVLGCLAAYAIAPSTNVRKARKTAEFSSLALDTTSGGHIQVSGADFCADVQTATTNVHLWTCVPGNNNQQFSLLPSRCEMEGSKEARLMWMSNRPGLQLNGAKRCIAPGLNSNGVVANCAEAPTFAIPASRTGQIQLQSDMTKCLAIVTSAKAGANLQIADCLQDAALTTWDLSATPSYVVGTIQVNGKCIKAGTVAKSSAALEPCDESAAQKWIFPEGGRTGLIRSEVNSNLCLDIVDAQITSGQTLQIYNCIDGGHKAQLFNIPIVNATGGTCRVAVDQELCMQDHFGSVILGACTEATAACETFHDCQTFVIPTTTTTTTTTEPTCSVLADATIPAGEYVLRNMWNNKVVTAVGGGTTIETNLALEDYVPGNAWAKFTTSSLPAGGSIVQFQSVHATGQYINVAGGSTQAGGNVQMYNNPTSSDSQWKAQTCDGEYVFVSANTGINGIAPVYLSAMADTLNVETSATAAIANSHWLLQAVNNTQLQAAPMTALVGVHDFVNAGTDQYLTRADRRLANAISTGGSGTDLTQEWIVAIPDASAPSVITIESNYQAGQYLNAEGTASGVNIGVTPGAPTTATRWQAFQPEGNTTFVFQVQGSNPPAFLGMPAGSNVVANTDYTLATTQWRLAAAPKAELIAAAVTPGNYTLEIVGAPPSYIVPGGLAAGGNVVAVPEGGPRAQWQIEAVTGADNTYTIKHVQQGYYLSDGGSALAGANIIAAAAPGTGTFWQFIAGSGTGQFALRSSTGNTFLTVLAGTNNVQTTSDSNATTVLLPEMVTTSASPTTAMVVPQENPEAATVLVSHPDAPWSFTSVGGNGTFLNVPDLETTPARRLTNAAAHPQQWTVTRLNQQDPNTATVNFQETTSQKYLGWMALPAQEGAPMEDCYRVGLKTTADETTSWKVLTPLEGFPHDGSWNMTHYVFEGQGFNNGNVGYLALDGTSAIIMSNVLDPRVQWNALDPAETTAAENSTATVCEFPQAADGYEFPDNTPLTNCTSAACTSPSITGVICAQGYAGTVSISGCTSGAPAVSLSGCQATTCQLPLPAPADYVYNAQTLSSCTSALCSAPVLVGVNCADGLTGAATTSPCTTSDPFVTLNGCTQPVPQVTACQFPTAQLGYEIDSNTPLSNCDSNVCDAPVTTGLTCAAGYGGTPALTPCASGTPIVALSGCTAVTCMLPVGATTGYSYAVGGHSLTSCTSADCANPAITGVECAAGYTGTVTASQCTTDAPTVTLSGCQETACELPTSAPSGYVFSGPTLSGCTQVTCSSPTLSGVSCDPAFTDNGLTVSCDSSSTTVTLSNCDAD